MPKYYCEYCNIYLTHSSPAGRKQHNRGRKHINNKIEYYSEFLLDQHAMGQATGSLQQQLNLSIKAQQPQMMQPNYQMPMVMNMGMAYQQVMGQQLQQQQGNTSFSFQMNQAWG